MEHDDQKKTEKKPKGEGKKILFFGVIIVVLAIAGYFLSQGKANVANADKINFDLYVMSQCPYGTQAEEAVMGAMDGFEDYVNFNVEYIAKANPDGTFQSLHGEPEVQGNLHQLCVKTKAPDKFWDYLKCQNPNYQDITSTFESCAKEVGLNYDDIKACAEGDEGTNLFKESIAKSDAVKATGSPTFYIAGQQYTGNRTPVALQRALCAALDNKAKKCGDIPQDKEFTAYVVNDPRCTKPECDTASLKSQLQSTFSKIKFEELDYSTAEGLKFYEENGLTVLPAILFAPEVKSAENFASVEPYLVEAGDLFNLRIGASFDPSMEICDNNIDDTGNGQVDCDDSDCADFLGCRSEVAKRLDLFVMSQCPYGTMALNAMAEVLDNFGSNVDFHINYIANENADGTFQSLHGQGEVDENIRELCAIKYYPSNYMDYIWCRNENITGDYSSCAANFPKVKTCFESDEGAGLLSENIKLANELAIGASPTWMVNNRYTFNGIDAETVKTNFCQYNDVAGCDETLSGQTGTVAGSCN